MIGQTLAQYEITGMLGKGGMGEVYRAHDKKLDRGVALKILPRELSGDPERAARFEREARTLASLQHPNIASIYDYEKFDDVRFLAMELVEGQDLAERLRTAKFSVDDVVRIGRQMALGLEAAHEKNIVHRDLKPANIKIDPDGVVKILDFGLARAYAGDSEDRRMEDSPTITFANTRLGVILGTAAYMSPEQARGRAIDKRSDIWSFGVILFELLTGRPLYQGETATDVLGAIIHTAPSLEALPNDLPPALRKLIERCLTADVHDRLRDIGEARYTLHHMDASEKPEPRATRRLRPLWMIAFLFVLVAAFGLSMLVVRSPKATRPVLQTSVTLPDGCVLIATGPRGGSIRVSPGGDAIAFVAQKDGQRQIWVRNLEERVAQPVPGTEGGYRPFWSPDGRSLGFFADGKLRRISVRGGAALTITSAPDGRGAAWLQNGSIVFAPTPGSALSVVAAAGGESRVVTDPQRSDREPRWLPGADQFVYLEERGGGRWQMKVGNVEGDAPIEVGLSSGGVEYADGKLLFLQNQTLVAQSFDVNTLQLTGEPTPVAEGVLRDPAFGIGVFSTSNDGVLAFQPSTNVGAQLQWIDRDGTVMGNIGEQLAYDHIGLAPDSKTIAVMLGELDGGSDIWMIDSATGLRQRFTFTPENAFVERNYPVWSPDGSLLAYSRRDQGMAMVYTKRTDGSGQETRLLQEDDHDVWPYGFTPDGEWVLFGREEAGGNEDLWIIPVSGEGEARALVQSPFDEWPGRFSPDSRWLAFDSNETGRWEIFVIPYGDDDGRGGKWQITREGGRSARWSADGRELFYLDLTGKIVAVPVDGSGQTFIAGDPVVLFSTDLGFGSDSEYDYDIVDDRFLVLKRPPVTVPISLYVNWMEALEKR